MTMVAANPNWYGSLLRCSTIRLLITLALLISGADVGAAAQPAVIIKMLDTPPSFQPATVKIKVGGTVEWRNVGDSAHHATDDQQMAIKSADVNRPDGAVAFDSGFLRPGETFTHTFNKPGVYKYVCAVHEAQGMIGEVVVE